MAKGQILQEARSVDVEDTAEPIHDRHVVEGKAPERFSSTPARPTRGVIQSPLQSRDGLKIRPREGYHQTWKRDDEYDEALDQGYRVVRKPKDGAKIEEAGQETGDILRRMEGNDRYIVAMEIPQHIIDEHLRAVVAKSESLIHDDQRVTRDFVEGANRSYNKEHLEVAFESESFEEELSGPKRRGVKTVN